MDPYDVRKYIESTGVPYGENVTLPEDIDTNQCSDFFGTRCDHHVPVKGRRKAHIDRVDPRYNPASHLKHDVGIPYTLMGAAAGGGLGAIFGKDKKDAAVKGALIGGVLGLLGDVASTYSNKSNQGL